MKKIVLVGFGEWGKKIYDTLAQFDIIPIIANRDNWQQLIDQKPDGIIIATPPQSHIQIAEFSLQRQIPTFIEKPLSLSLLEAQKLEKYKNVPILINHIHLFSEQFQYLKEKCHNFSEAFISEINYDKILEKITNISSIGCNYGYFRDYSSLYDYGCHDIAMILYLLKEYPKKINIEQVDTDVGELFRIDLEFSTTKSQSLIGNGAKHKIRKFKVISNGISLVYNDLPTIDSYSPLYHALNTFLHSIDKKDYQDDRLGIELALNTVKILGECEELLKKGRDNLN